MKEILFRAKAKEDGKWIEGFPVRIYDYGGLVWDIHPFNTNFEITRSVDPKTIGQFIGITDKNGKKVFEGDIIIICYEADGEDFCETKRVHYNEKECCWYPMRWEECCEYCGHYTEIKSIEIIGNIHDNANLLE